MDKPLTEKDFEVEGAGAPISIRDSVQSAKRLLKQKIFAFGYDQMINKKIQKRIMQPFIDMVDDSFQIDDDKQERR